MHAALPEDFADLGIVFTITGEPVYLAHDHVVHAVGVLSDVFKHSLKLGTVC